MGYPPPLRKKNSAKKFGKKGVTDLGGNPLPPFTDFSPEIFLQKGLKIVFFAKKKNLILVQVIGYEFGGYPPPLLYGFFFSEKGVTDLGGPPPPPPPLLYGQNPQSSI